MKKKILLFTALTGMLTVTLLSNNLGPAKTSLIDGNRTGAVGSGTCAASGCHSTGSTLGTFAKIIDKNTGWNVTTGFGYVEGHTYTVTLNGVHSFKTNFGFQACVLYDADQKPSTKPIATNALTQVMPTKATGGTDTIWVVEHKQKMTGLGGNFNVDFDWPAPAVGANKGAVKFWGIVNAVNANTAADTGDHVSGTFTKVLANVTSVDDVAANTNVTVYPNPLKDNLNIKLENPASGKYTITAFDMSGRKMMTEEFTYNSSVPFSYNTSSWAPGFYHVQLAKDGMTHTTSLIKY
jgi:predicted CxxxxCH...CXXCH cytochrome family protein